MYNTYCAHLFYCMAQLMHVVIYLLGLLRDLLTSYFHMMARFASMCKPWSLAQSWLSSKRKPGSYTVFLILNCIAVDLHGKLTCRALLIGKEFAQVLISNCNAGITLMLHGSGYATLYFEEGVCKESSRLCSTSIKR